MTAGLKGITRIPETLKVVSACWQSAEESLRAEIREVYPRADEEFITRLFHGQLAKALKKANSKRQIEQAFLADLQAAYPDYRLSLAPGFMAQVTLHKRDTEAATGGDIGFVIERPQVTLDGDQFRVSMRRQGLLCQAKLKYANGKWDTLTKNQTRVLPDRLRFLGLLLYSYQDRQRRTLRPFQWQLCRSASSLDEVAQWLKQDSFPRLLGSNAIIVRLGSGKIGTSNRRLIETVVAPPQNVALVITIGWSEDDSGQPKIQMHITDDLPSKNILGIKKREKGRVLLYNLQM